MKVHFINLKEIFRMYVEKLRDIEYDKWLIGALIDQLIIENEAYLEKVKIKLIRQKKKTKKKKNTFPYRKDEIEKTENYIICIKDLIESDKKLVKILLKENDLYIWLSKHPLFSKDYLLTLEDEADLNTEICKR